MLRQRKRLYHFLCDKAVEIVRQQHAHLDAETIASAILSNYRDDQFNHEIDHAKLPAGALPDDEAVEGLALGGGQLINWVTTFYANHKQLCDMIIGIMVQVALKALGL